MRIRDVNVIMMEMKVGGAKAVISGLIFACPVFSNPKMPDMRGCPFCEVRRWPPEKRADWLENISDETALKLVHKHMDCVNKQGRD